jgi:hypothetical protein
MSSWSDHSLLVAMQSAFGTPNTTDGDFEAIDAEYPKVSFETSITELDTMTGVVGAASRRQVGSRRGKVTFKLPLEGFVNGYNPTAENPGGAPVAGEVIPLWLALAGNAMGSNNSAIASMANFIRGLGLSTSEYTAAGMASGTASTIVCDAAAASNKIDVGQLVVASLTTDPLAPQIGFAKTKAVQTVTLFEDAKNDVNDNAADLYGTATAYASSEVSATHPLTFRWTGPATALCYELLDAMCESIKGTWNSGEVPTVEFTYTFYDYRVNKLDGGLVVPTVYAEVPQIVGTVNGLATFNGTQKCSLESCTWEWSATLRETKCHGASNGVSAVNVIKPRFKAAFSVLHDTADAVFDAGGSSANVGQHIYQSALELGSRVSLGVYVGSQVGKIWALLMPSAIITAVPQVSLRDDEVAYQIELEAASYAADSTDTAETSADSPLDSIGRISLG